LSGQATVGLIVSACAVYSAVLLWMSRRQFVELELKDGQISRAAQIPEALVPRKLTELFRARSTGAVANLIRKEVCLQKPIFLVSAVFIVCWLLTVILMLLHPTWHNELVAALYGLTGTQMVLMVILTGCVSLGDDKALGTTAWHLTLPISARRQWVIKLFAAAATLFAMAVLLPTILSALTLFKVQAGLLILHSHSALGMLLAAAVVFIISFWSASLVSNTVRAAITTVVALIAISACVFLGGGLSQRLLIPWPSDSHSLQSGLITSIIAHFQLPPDFFWQHPGVIAYSITLVTLVATSIALRQSLGWFRRIHISNLAALKGAAILAAVIIAGSFWCQDLIGSIGTGGWRLELEFQQASASFWQKKGGFAAHDAYTVTSSDLEQAASLSDKAKIWLRNSRITFTPITASKDRRLPRLQVLLAFPNGQQYSFESSQPQTTESKP
jgi:hypothetical protein